MPQQLNLLDASLHRRRPLGTARQGLVLLGVLTFACLLAHLGLQVLAQRARGELDGLQQAMDARRQQLSAGAVAPGTNPAEANAALAAIEAEWRRLRQLDATQRHVDTLLASGQAGRAQGHSAVLLALARQADPAVWLTGLSLGADGDTMEFEGRMADAVALPGYLQRLQNEPLLRGRRFAQLGLQRVEAGAEGNLGGAAYTRFVLRSQIASTSAGASIGMPAAAVLAGAKP